MSDFLFYPEIFADIHRLQRRWIYNPGDDGSQQGRIFCWVDNREPPEHFRGTLNIPFKDLHVPLSALLELPSWAELVELRAPNAPWTGYRVRGKILLVLQKRYPGRHPLDFQKIYDAYDSPFRVVNTLRDMATKAVGIQTYTPSSLPGARWRN